MVARIGMSSVSVSSGDLTLKKNENKSKIKIPVKNEKETNYHILKLMIAFEISPQAEIIAIPKY